MLERQRKEGEQGMDTIRLGEWGSRGRIEMDAEEKVMNGEGKRVNERKAEHWKREQVGRVGKLRKNKNGG